MTHLLDGNVLAALAVPDHVHHDAADRWWGSRADEPFATCPITQGTLLRVSMVHGRTIAQARHLLMRICAHPQHEFWPDDAGYPDVPLHGVLGQRQVTDAYLAELARRSGGRLITLDAGLAALHPDVAEVIPV